MNFTVFTFGLYAILIAFLAFVIMLLRAKNIMERIILVNTLGTVSVLFIAIHGYWTGRPDFLDNSLTICVLSIVGMLAFNQLIRHFVVNKDQNRKEED